MKKIDWKDVGKRAGKTFVQALLASGAFDMDKLVMITDVESAKAILRPMLIAGVAAGISAVWNMATRYIKQKKEGVWYNGKY